MFADDYDDSQPKVRKSIEACSKVRQLVVPPTVDPHINNGEPVSVAEFPHQVGELK